MYPRATLAGAFVRWWLARPVRTQEPEQLSLDNLEKFVASSNSLRGYVLCEYTRML